MRGLARTAAASAALALSAALLVVPASAAPVPPAATDDSARVAGRSVVVIDVLANDAWTGTPALTLPRSNQAGAPDHGDLALTTTTAGGVERPAIEYTPDRNWFGVDTFTYTLSDDTGQDAVATVTATTTPVPPTAGPDAATTPPGRQVRISVLGNDSEPYGRGLVLSAVANPKHGSAVVDGDDVLYTPDDGWSGDDAFLYRITSDTGAVARALITVTTLDSTPGHSITLSATPAVIVQRSMGFKGAVDPLEGGPVTVAVQRRTSAGWRTVATTKATSVGRYFVSFRPDVVGTITWRARAVWADGSVSVVQTQTTVTGSADPVVSGPLTRASVPYSYRNGCPVGPSKLRRISINYWAYDGTVKRGSIIVRDWAVTTVRAVIRKSFDVKFRFKVIKPVDYFYAGGARSPSGSDIAAMNAGNTSAFNCRPVTGNRYRISQHSYGNAIDINTFENPYVTWSRVYPAAAEYPYYRFRSQNLDDHGVIAPYSVVAQSFKAFGWVWGGRWSPPDYQHFSSNGG
ncbi:MAG: Ig-like domain-containing protein [Candidatus Nanopelagicales bacterium]